MTAVLIRYPLTDVLLLGWMGPAIAEIVELVADHLANGRDEQAKALVRVVMGAA